MRPVLLVSVPVLASVLAVASCASGPPVSDSSPSVSACKLFDAAAEITNYSFTLVSADEEVCTWSQQTDDGTLSLKVAVDPSTPLADVRLDDGLPGAQPSDTLVSMRKAKRAAAANTCRLALDSGEGHVLVEATTHHLQDSCDVATFTARTIDLRLPNAVAPTLPPPVPGRPKPMWPNACDVMGTPNSTAVPHLDVPPTEVEPGHCRTYDRDDENFLDLHLHQGQSIDALDLGDAQNVAEAVLGRHRGKHFQSHGTCTLALEAGDGHVTIAARMPTLQESCHYVRWFAETRESKLPLSPSGGQEPPARPFDGLEPCDLSGQGGVPAPVADSPRGCIWPYTFNGQQRQLRVSFRPSAPMSDATFDFQASPYLYFDTTVGGRSAKRVESRISDRACGFAVPTGNGHLFINAQTVDMVASCDVALAAAAEMEPHLPEATR